MERVGTAEVLNLRKEIIMLHHFMQQSVLHHFNEYSTSEKI